MAADPRPGMLRYALTDTPALRGTGRAQVGDFPHEPYWDRTSDPLLKRPSHGVRHTIPHHPRREAPSFSARRPRFGWGGMSGPHGHTADTPFVDAPEGRCPRPPPALPDGGGSAAGALSGHPQAARRAAPRGCGAMLTREALPPFQPQGQRAASVRQLRPSRTSRLTTYAGRTTYVLASAYLPYPFLLSNHSSPTAREKGMMRDETPDPSVRHAHLGNQTARGRMSLDVPRSLRCGPCSLAPP